MRLKRSRVKKYYHKTRTMGKDSEGSTYDVYGASAAFSGEVWPASGKVQAEMYGEKLSYIRNVRIQGKYVITTDRKNQLHYVFPDGLDITESDGLCLYVPQEAEPDYRVISIKPYTPLRLEVEKL